MASSELRRDIKLIDQAPGIRLHRGSAMVAAGVVLAMVFNAANLPSPLYVIYKDRFGFSEITLTLVFAVYVVGSVVAMTVFGRRRTMSGADRCCSWLWPWRRSVLSFFWSPSTPPRCSRRGS